MSHNHTECKDLKTIFRGIPVNLYILPEFGKIMAWKNLLLRTGRVCFVLPLHRKSHDPKLVILPQFDLLCDSYKNH